MVSLFLDRLYDILYITGSKTKKSAPFSQTRAQVGAQAFWRRGGNEEPDACA